MKTYFSGKLRNGDEVVLDDGSGYKIRVEIGYDFESVPPLIAQMQKSRFVSKWTNRKAGAGHVAFAENGNGEKLYFALDRFAKFKTPTLSRQFRTKEACLAEGRSVAMRYLKDLTRWGAKGSDYVFLKITLFDSSNEEKFSAQKFGLVEGAEQDLLYVANILSEMLISSMGPPAITL